MGKCFCVFLLKWVVFSSVFPFFRRVVWFSGHPDSDIKNGRDIKEYLPLFTKTTVSRLPTLPKLRLFPLDLCGNTNNRHSCGSSCVKVNGPDKVCYTYLSGFPPEPAFGMIGGGNDGYAEITVTQDCTARIEL